MTAFHNYGRKRFFDRTLLLSTSIPTQESSNKYLRVTDTRREIEEAIVSLARATFSQGGRLAFGGAPSISILLALVAAEYLQPRFAEGERDEREVSEEFERRSQAPISVYQSMALQDEVPEIQFLHRLGYVTAHWIAHEESGGVTRRMIEESNPVAMVCIGGMEDVVKEVGLFYEMRRQLPIYAMATTGGAAGILAREGTANIQVIDRELMDSIGRIAQEVDTEREGEERFEIRYMPYTLIMQKMVEGIIGTDLPR
jgi:hypothetical protein